MPHGADVYIVVFERGQCDAIREILDAALHRHDDPARTVGAM
jgi:hypothetical protein